MTKPIISFVILILSIVFAFLYVLPAYNLNAKLRGDIESLTSVLGQSKEIKMLIDETKTKLGGIEKSGMDRFDVFLPETIDPIRFANNMQYIGRKNKIILSDIKVEEPVNGVVSAGASSGVTALQGLVNVMSLGSKIDKAQGSLAQQITQSGTPTVGKYAATKASFSFMTTFETFQAFLDDMEKSLGVIDVVSLSFSPTAVDTSASAPRAPLFPTYQYSMTIETYSLK
ncbi:MAG: hypothetical protein COV32_02585 [Candidatus Yonathbacteria bacterium CG10_big_fil_rev_8_21_14_0_10_43_136]|uniref:Uncharacterized protein n=2 Tax=Parcubacteria group TaxID=1794811 RepID=A0A2M7Q3T0_9BACT|nr:MAG: hypothetical protein AUK15_02105 [Candidatus Nomurabacteria bacterium CG2_30_43_9]PIR40562.1 MAG: hypothetical protein COV32_02585 [Candidatus Yonathbacteria bacterium CG10_big_fil_rev_8_21_14_0_10_43_136]PIX56939.1 MAG: hypothetical protein COZ48_03325 [Candidatus Yonathbacteria bacterium CG_4_10_14_3_um_filter_43_12]PIY58076.1 MAG: hypothetical protein COY98_03925 [Candidatus Yonathbacteria bacterium CG_4_10_14_0_8_um_filter_43_17]PJC22294.1 MAG: hypothetical protein CO060_00940 [Cand